MQAFPFYYPSKGVWVLEDQNPPVFENPDCHVEKMMITVIWGVYGTYLGDDHLKGTHFNSMQFVESILKPLEE